MALSLGFGLVKPLTETSLDTLIKQAHAMKRAPPNICNITGVSFYLETVT